MTAPDLLSAAAAGFLSFISPCVLPLVPAYLSFISGSTVSELRTGGSRLKVFAASLAFSGGFTTAFTILGIVFSGAARLVGGASIWLGTVGGIVVAILGFNMIFDFFRFLGAHVGGEKDFAGVSGVRARRGDAREEANQRSEENKQGEPHNG